MVNVALVVLGKIISKFFRFLRIGDGSTWPGHIALKLNKKFIKEVLSQSSTQIIIVAGTNGKTTTAAMIKSALKKNGVRAFQNKSGANLLNGIASSLIMHSSLTSEIKHDFAIFEIDENALSQALKQITPDFLLLLNLFRDQLDRYGEINSIILKWKDSIQDLSNKTKIILNADDPQIAYLSINTKATCLFFGIGENNQKSNSQYAADSIYCPRCAYKLTYTQISFSHLGNWKCKSCGLKRPDLDLGKFSTYPLPGIYNAYNTHAAALTLKQIGINNDKIDISLQGFKPSFGRQETIKYKNRNVQVFLSKNPTSFNQSFQTIKDLGGKQILIILNDRIPDGRDVSWIWDTDLNGIENLNNIVLSGDRVYDMGIRLKYELGIENYKLRVRAFEELEKAINYSINNLDENQTLYMLPTYSAMLETRKILTGKKIL